MGKIYYMMGKSSSGKDTLYQEIGRRCPELRRIVPYTTRPIREGERDGETYYFVDDDRLAKLERAGKVIELRAYHTVHGIWKYFTADDGQIDLDSDDYLTIGTLESYEKMRNYYGPEALVPIYIEVEDGERLARALRRERRQPEPKYKELCRRFLADEEDFSEEKLAALDIDQRYENADMETCLEKILGGIYSGKL